MDGTLDIIRLQSSVSSEGDEHRKQDMQRGGRRVSSE